MKNGVIIKDLSLKLCEPIKPNKAIMKYNNKKNTFNWR